MGFLHYGSRPLMFDDRLLHHLQIAVALKLRRSENFFLSWKSAPGSGDGRHSVWIDNGVPLHFEYSGSRVPALNREWLDTLIDAANSAGGLNISDERNAEPRNA
jgi:hypothetical protein